MKRLAILIATIIFAGCNYTDIKPSSGPALSAEQLTTFSSLEVNILQQKCLRCHSGSSAAAGLDLSQYQTILAFPSAVLPGNPQASLLYAEVLSGDMPLGGPPLDAVEVQAIFNWIQSGAPNSAN